MATTHLTINDVFTSYITQLITAEVTRQREELTEQISSIKKSIASLNSKVQYNKQAVDGLRSDKTAYYKKVKALAAGFNVEEIKQQLDDIAEAVEALQGMNEEHYLHFDNIEEQMQEIQTKAIYTATSTAAEIMRLSREDFINWVREKVARITTKTGKTTNIVYRNLYKQFKPDTADLFSVNFEFYHGNNKLEMLADMKDSPEHADRQIVFEFVENVQKVAR